MAHPLIEYPDQEPAELVWLHRPGGHFSRGGVPFNDLDELGANLVPEKPVDLIRMISVHPVHKVYIDAFYMDKYEVTNTKYLKFCKATGHQLPEFWNMKGFRCSLDCPSHPVVGVSWNDAVDYAKWCGKRLPTEA